MKIYRSLCIFSIINNNQHNNINILFKLGGGGGGGIGRTPVTPVRALMKCYNLAQN